MVRKTFGETAERLTNLESNNREIVYRIQKPLVATEEVYQGFFSNLETIFSVLSEFSPHFTQYSPEESESR